MAHPDNSWRVGAIYRSCVRYGMNRETCIEHMRAMGITRGDKASYENCADIWWRDMDKRRGEYMESRG